MCGTKNFVSVRLYTAPQSHWTIVAIFGKCAFEPVQAGSFAAIKSDPLPGLACSTSLERQAAGSVWDAYWSLDEANLCPDGNEVIGALFSSGDSGIANQQCEGFLKRKLHYSFRAQSRRDFRPTSGGSRSTDGSYGGVLGVPHALQILDSNLPPDSIHFG